MSLDLNNYSKVIYVSSNGSDNNDGSKDSPYLTIDYAKSQVDTDNTLVMIDKGEYEITSLTELSKNGYFITYMGKGKNTIITTNKTGSAYYNKTFYYNFIVKPNITGLYTGDARFINYTSDTREIRYYNILFTNSDDNAYPTQAFLIHNSSAWIEANKYYHNCSFIDKTGKLIVNTIGYGHFINCATNNTKYLNSNLDNNSTYANNSNLSTSIKGVSFDDNYNITDKDNNLIYGVYSGDNAWKDIKVLIKENNKFYSIKEEYYNSDTQLFNELIITDEIKNNWDEYAFSISSLFEPITINGETFTPINKFNKFQLIIKDKTTAKILGRKSDKQLVVASNSFSTKIAENIDYFKATFNVDNNSYIKMAMSVDEGQTWKTTSDNGTTWTDLTCVIPLKEYSDLTADELIEWNNALTEIDTNGFNIANIENIDFNTIKDKTIMFAYVLYQDTYDSICDNLSLDWQFDAKGKMQKMKDSEVEVSLLEDKVIITPTIDNDMIKVNILNGVPEGTGSGDIDIDEATSEDIQNILNKEW